MSIKLADKNLQKIIKHISLIHGIPVATVDHIIRYNFAFIRSRVLDGNLESIRLKHLGIFAVKPGRKELLDSGK